ncbi:putative Microprocessor complex subunit DGCR8 [Hypsibius exemplaris]|uniref:Microprocessor complex subunit DGCR8 n=1 Tax=Hypsibius exemplaris TaxID=2072580 RepID=A0A1W0WCZ7_HYPEX|nr:putative Microprocessor complex subunit DGCR8 [Hypsibius exemplaris]
MAGQFDGCYPHFGAWNLNDLLGVPNTSDGQQFGGLPEAALSEYLQVFDEDYSDDDDNGLSIYSSPTDTTLSSPPGSSNPGSNVQLPPVEASQFEKGEIKDVADEVGASSTVVFAPAHGDDDTAGTTVCRRKYRLLDGGELQRLGQKLPEGWTVLTHESGLPVFFHQPTRVLTFGKPYALDDVPPGQPTGNATPHSHAVPMDAVPCFSGRNRENRSVSQGDGGTNPIVENSFTLDAGFSSDSSGGCGTVSSVSAPDYPACLTPDELRDYCSGRFTFQCSVVRSKQDRRPDGGKVQRLSLHPPPPEHSKKSAASAQRGQIISFTRPSHDGTGEMRVQLNLSKSHVSMLQDYLQRTRRLLPVYEFRQPLDTAHTHEVIILLDGQEVSAGAGSTKKAAKDEAAGSLLLKLAPELRDVLAKTTAESSPGVVKQSHEAEVFGDMSVDDFRVSELAFQAGMVNPSEALLRALCCLDRRNVSLVRSRMAMTARRLSEYENEYTMTAGPYTASVIMGEPLKAKFLCAQRILKQMHPELPRYVDVLRLYGAEYTARIQQRREQDRSIYATVAGPSVVEREPNWALMEKLREEMHKVLPVCPGALSSIRYT